MSRARPPALVALLPLAGVLLAAAGCDEPGPTATPGGGPEVTLSVEGVPPAPAGYVYQLWFVDGEGGLHPGARRAAWDAGGVVETSPTADPAALMLTLEPEPDDDPAPTQLKFLGGRFRDGIAGLDVTGYLTPNIPLEQAPGVHVLGTHAASGPPGVPDRQDAGLWLMDPARDTLSGYYQTFTPLTDGWTYEGWVVRDAGAPGEVWVSYGKFRPNGFRQANSRDDTGLGPFSGKADWERALPVDVRVPGDDWLANPFGYPVPGGLELPFDLNGPEGGTSRWTHVITIEPYEDRDEDPWAARPFFLRPYRNAVGEAAPAVPRVIGFDPAGLPQGTAVLRR